MGKRTAIVFQILNTGGQVAASRRRRLWLRPGQSMHLGNGVVVMLVVDKRSNGDCEPGFEVHRPGDAHHAKVSLIAFTLRTWCGVDVVPRAYERRWFSGQWRVLVEFQFVGGGEYEKCSNQ